MCCQKPVCRPARCSYVFFEILPLRTVCPLHARAWNGLLRFPVAHIHHLQPLYFTIVLVFMALGVAAVPQNAASVGRGVECRYRWRVFVATC